MAFGLIVSSHWVSCVCMSMVIITPMTIESIFLSIGLRSTVPCAQS